MTKQIHLPAPVEPALKPPLALLGWGGVGVKCEEKRQRMREDQERFLQFLISLQVGDQLQTRSNTHTQTHQQERELSKKGGRRGKEHFQIPRLLNVFIIIIVVVVISILGIR